MTLRSIFHTALLPAFYAILPSFFPCLQLLQSKAIHCAAKAYNFACFSFSFRTYDPLRISAFSSITLWISPHFVRQDSLWRPVLEVSTHDTKSFIKSETRLQTQISLPLYSLGLAGVLGTVGGVTPQMGGVVLLLWKVILPEQNQGVPLSWSWILTKRGDPSFRHCCQFYRTPNSAFRAGVTNANAPRYSLMTWEVTAQAEWPVAGRGEDCGKWEGMCSVSKGSHCPAPARLPSGQNVDSRQHHVPGLLETTDVNAHVTSPDLGRTRNMCLLNNSWWFNRLPW